MNNSPISWFGNIFNMNQSVIFSKENEFLIMHSEFKFNSTMTGFEVFSSNNGKIEIKVAYLFFNLSFFNNPNFKKIFESFIY